MEIKVVCLSAWRRRYLSALEIGQAENKTESLEDVWCRYTVYRKEKI